MPSRLRARLEGALPRGFALVESDRSSCRLCPDVVVEAIDWEALRSHHDPRVRRLCAAHGARARVGS